MIGVGFKDCKTALDETKGDIEKSVEFLRKKEWQGQKNEQNCIRRFSFGKRI